MATNLAEPTAAELAGQTEDWLRANLPAGWLDAIDRGDHGAVEDLRAALDLPPFLRALGEAGYATPTWPAEYGAGLGVSPRRRGRSPRCSSATRRRARSTSSASAWAGRP